MNCRTAQQLLTFDRPHAPELCPEDRAALGRHLAVCAKCRAVEQLERNVDDALGHAMRAVEPPAGLERQLHANVERAYEDDRRRWWRTAGRNALAAAASLLVLIGAGVGWQWWARPVADPELAHMMFVEAFINPPSADDIEKNFQHQGVRTDVPQKIDGQEINYNLCIDHRLAEFQGKFVPQLWFHRVDGQREDTARIYILSARQFNLAQMVNPQVGPPGSRYRLEIRHHAGESYAYLIVHTGENLAWLFRRPEKAA